MSNRYFLCLLFSIGLVYYALPHIKMVTERVEALFFAAWMLFALFVISGNIIGMLARPKRIHGSKAVRVKRKAKQKIRSYSGS